MEHWNLTHLVLGHAADLATNVLDLTEPNMTNVQVVLKPYRIYSPCHFSMIDDQNHSLTDSNACVSGDFAISDTKNWEGQVWSLNNAAPLVPVLATAGSGGVHASVGEAIVWLPWTMLLGVVRERSISYAYRANIYDKSILIIPLEI